MKTKAKTRNRPHAPFQRRVDLFNQIDEKRLYECFKDTDKRMFDPYVRKFKSELCRALTKWGRFGTYEETGELHVPHAYRQAQRLEHAQEQGFLTRDKTPEFFDDIPVLRDSAEYVPDTTFLDFFVSERMNDVVETRDTWDADLEFVLMKEAGQVKYGKMSTEQKTMRNDEWGSGIEIEWTWLETNKFKINMQRLAPKFKYQAMDQQADLAYGVFTAAATQALLADFAITPTNIFINDYNLAVGALMRWENAFGKRPFENASFRIIAAPESWYFIDRALRAHNGIGDDPKERFFRRPAVTYTTKLPANTPGVVYVVVDKWEQNEYATRIPLEAHGPQDDIDLFATKVSYRYAVGAAFDVNSAIKLTFTLDATFSPYDPVRTKAMP